MKRFRQIWFVALAMLAAARPAQALEPSVQRVAEVMRQVGQVIASGCAGSGDRSGTAFVWPDAQRVVTARHVVAGCSRLRVQFPGGASFIASPERELAANDLVLLRLASATSLPPLTVVTQIPPIHAKVAAIGYALGAPTPDDKLLTVTAGNAPPGAKLSDLLEQRFRQQIQSSGALSLATAILRLDGNLVNGLSGAPVIGPDGAVVAIGSGGLQDGAGGIVWAVRASYLPSLLQQQPINSVAALARSTALTFADQAPQAVLRTQQCGSFKLSLARTVALSELADTSDDPRGLAQLLATIGSSLSRSDADRFDVWVDIQSGAAIPLPAGTQLQQGPVGCVASVFPNIGFNIVTIRSDAATPSGQGAQMASVMLENTINMTFPGLTPDPSFTYTAPLVRRDGFIATRKAAGRSFSEPTGRNQADYVFLTHMTRGDTYVAVAAFRTVVMDSAQLQYCQTNFSAQGCPGDAAHMHAWAMAAAAVQLATIPPI